MTMRNMTMKVTNQSILAAVLIAFISISANDAGATPNLHSAVLPTSRAVMIGTTASFFATLINGGDETATNCRIELPGLPGGDFSFQRTRANDNTVIGERNELVDLEPGSSQSYALFIDATEAIPQGEQEPVFVCDNATPAPTLQQINTFDFVASATPVPDVIAFAATQSADGRLELLNATATEAFVVAIANLGEAADLEFSAAVSDPNLPLTLSWCPTDALTSECLSPLRVTSRRLCPWIRMPRQPSQSL